MPTGGQSSWKRPTFHAIAASSPREMASASATRTGRPERRSVLSTLGPRRPQGHVRTNKQATRDILRTTRRAAKETKLTGTDVTNRRRRPHDWETECNNCQKSNAQPGARTTAGSFPSYCRTAARTERILFRRSRRTTVRQTQKVVEDNNCFYLRSLYNT